MTTEILQPSKIHFAKSSVSLSNCLTEQNNIWQTSGDTWSCFQHHMAMPSKSPAGWEEGSLCNYQESGRQGVQSRKALKYQKWVLLSIKLDAEIATPC